MDLENLIFLNVDTANDFMRKEGSLYIPDAEKIDGQLAYLTGFAREYGVRIINQADWHRLDSPEISDSPDYVSTFPAHCLEGTWGAQFIEQTRPIGAYTVPWRVDKGSIDFAAIKKAREIIAQKDQTDSFGRRSNMPSVIDALLPHAAVVYGVATNVCDDQAIMGLSKKGLELYIVTDAMKELPVDLSLPRDRRLASTLELHEKWTSMGATLIDTASLRRYIS